MKRLFIARGELHEMKLKRQAEVMKCMLRWDPHRPTHYFPQHLKHFGFLRLYLCRFLFPGCFPHPLCLPMPTLPRRFSCSLCHVPYEALTDHYLLPFPGKINYVFLSVPFMPSPLYHLNMCLNVYIFVLHVDSRSWSATDHLIILYVLLFCIPKV